MYRSSFSCAGVCIQGTPKVNLIITTFFLLQFYGRTYELKVITAFFRIIDYLCNYNETCLAKYLLSSGKTSSLKLESWKTSFMECSPRVVFMKKRLCMKFLFSFIWKFSWFKHLHIWILPPKQSWWFGSKKCSLFRMNQMCSRIVVKLGKNGKNWTWDTKGGQIQSSVSVEKMFTILNRIEILSNFFSREYNSSSYVVVSCWWYYILVHSQSSRSSSRPGPVRNSFLKYWYGSIRLILALFFDMLHMIIFLVYGDIFLAA